MAIQSLPPQRIASTPVGPDHPAPSQAYTTCLPILNQNLLHVSREHNLAAFSFHPTNQCFHECLRPTLGIIQYNTLYSDATSRWMSTYKEGNGNQDSTQSYSRGFLPSLFRTAVVSATISCAKRLLRSTLCTSVEGGLSRREGTGLLNKMNASTHQVAQ